MPLKPEDIDVYFTNRNNRFTNSQGMTFGLHPENGIWTNHIFLDIHPDTEFDDDSLVMSIQTECDSAADFISLFNLKEVDDIDKLSYVNGWMRYLNSQAEIIVEVIILEEDLRFRILNQKTIVYCIGMHFFDEVYHHLTLRDEIEDYILSSMDKLHTAAEHRYKY